MKSADGIRRWCVVAQTTLCLLFGEAARAATGPEETVLDKEGLAHILATIEPWPSEAAEYNTTNWDRLISAAKLVQKCDPATVEKALRERDRDRFTQGSEQSTNRSEEEGKLVLLMRVIFQLPEGEKATPDVTYEATGNFGHLNSDGTINFCWPVSWTGGKPKLVSENIMSKGIQPLYKSAEEYSFFRGRYPMRNLSKL